MIIVTGGSGFIGSNIVRELNLNGIEDVLIVDSPANKEKNLNQLKFLDLIDKDLFLKKLGSKRFSKNIKAILHQGACTDTTQSDFSYLMKNNFEYSKSLLVSSSNDKFKLIYASSASVYGNNLLKKSIFNFEDPLNFYAISKYLFDLFYLTNQKKIHNSVIGLRYFNVYGPGEDHKKRMASPIFQFNKQILKNNTIKVFEGSGGFGNGEQRRDYIYVNDICKIIMKLLHVNKKGIYDLGSGTSSSFNQLAKKIIKYHNKGSIKYIDFPSDLVGKYQHYTKSNNDIIKLIKNFKFTSLSKGISKYLKYLNA